MKRLRFTSLMVGCALLTAGCDRTADDADAPAAADTQATGGMADMPGMGGMRGQESMMEEMSIHMQAMRGAGPDSMSAMLPMHRQMLANMIAQMNREMRDMNMTTDPRWNATVDSLRADLTRMPDMTAQELHGFMPQHRDRVTRLMEMHRSMMRM